MAGPNHFDQFDDQPATTNVAPGNPSKVIKDRNAASASNFDPTIAAAEAKIKDAEARVALAKTQAERDKAIADAEKARSEADKARLDASSGSAKAATTVRADAITGYSTAQQLYGIIDDLSKKFCRRAGRDFRPFWRPRLPAPDRQQAVRHGGQRGARHCRTGSCLHWRSVEHAGRSQDGDWPVSAAGR
jgi:hypothetical protein